MDVVRFWDRMAAGYDRQAVVKYEKAYADTVALTRRYLKPTDAVLDFACGTGLVTVQLADKAASIRAIDISPGMIEQARAKCAVQGVRNVSLSVATLFDDSLAEESFDAVLAFNIFHILTDTPKYCARIRHLLKPGGLFLSVTDCLKETGFAALALYKAFMLLRVIPHVNILSQRDLTDMVEDAGFTIFDAQNLFEKTPNLYIAAKRL